MLMTQTDEHDGAHTNQATRRMMTMTQIRGIPLRFESPQLLPRSNDVAHTDAVVGVGNITISHVKWSLAKEV